jgi:hypothetical protein
MKANISFTYFNDWIKRITNSWTATKTSGESMQTEAVQHDIHYEPIPTKSSFQLQEKATVINMETPATNDYCSTY